MALTPEDLLGTPTGYATPEQLSSVQEMSKLLMQNSAGNQPITNKWQGPKLLADRALAMALMNRGGQQQMAGIQDYTHRLESAPGGAQGMGATPGIGQSSDIGLPQPSGAAQPGTAPKPAPAGMDPYDARTAQLESSGNPKAVTGHQYGLMQMGRPEIAKYGITNWQDPNQQISALHQERAANRSALTQALGRPPTPGEEYLAHQQGLGGAIALLKNPNTPAWQAIRGYYKNDAIAQQAIAGNPPGGGHFDPNQPAGAFTKGWINQFESRMPRGPGQAPQMPTGGQTADLSGSVGGVGAPPPNSPQAVSGALAGQQTAQASPQGQQIAAGPRPAPQATGPGVSNVGVPQFGPQYSPSNPQISRQDYEAIMANPWAPPELKQEVRQNYMKQYQPVVTEMPGIGRVIIPQGGRPGAGPPLTLPEVHTMETEGGEGTKYQTPFTYELGPQGLTRKIAPTVGTYPGQPQTPAKEETPGTKFNLPKVKPQSENVSPIGATPPGQNVPSGTTQTTQNAPGGPPTQPWQVASLGNTPPPSGSTQLQSNMLTQAPPGVGGATQVPSGGKGTQTAQYMDPYTKGTIQELQGLGAEGAAKKETATSNVKMFNDAYKGTQSAAATARNNIDSLKLAQKLAGTPGFPAGLFAEGRLDLQKLQAWWGNNPRAGMEAQEFDKIMAGQGVDQLRTIWAGAGLGQVRLAEFQTIMKSLASRANTPEAIQSLIGMMIKSHERVGEVGELQNWFQKGYRYDEDGNFTKPKNPSPPNIVDWNDTLEKYIKANPIIDPEDIKNFNAKYGSAKPPASKRGAPSTPKVYDTPPSGFVPYTPPGK